MVGLENFWKKKLVSKVLAEFARQTWQAGNLYGIIDLGYVAEANLEDKTRALLQGGVTLLQLRAKGYAEAEVLAFAKRIRTLCQEFSVGFIVNDFISVAKEVGADGVHLGQDDGPLEEARRRLDTRCLVGRSTHSREQAREALAEGADYIGFGPLFPTPTKEGRPAIGLAGVAQVEKEVGNRIPVFCIGGIKQGNLAEVKLAGARRVVVVSELLQAADTALAVTEIQESLS